MTIEKGHLAVFFDVGGVEIETSGENPPDVVIMREAAPVLAVSCAAGNGAAMTAVFDPKP